MKDNLKFSRFVHFYPLAETLAIYHAVKIKVLFIESGKQSPVPDRSDLLRQLDEEVVKQLFNEGFLIKIEDDEKRVLSAISRREVEKVDISLMYLILAENCNMACHYCFFEEGMPAKVPPMSIETAKIALDAFAQWVGSKKPAVIQLYGGDPFTNKRALRFAVGYTKELIDQGKLHKRSSVIIVCNGTLINKALVDFFCYYKKIVSISVSIDGPKEINDQWRVFHNQKGGYDRAIYGFKMLQEAGLNPGLSCTVPPSNIPHLEEITDWVLKLNPSGISYNTMTDIPSLKMDDQYANQVADFMIRSFRKYREHGLYEDRMMRKIKSFITEKRFLKDCCGYGQQIVVAPNGDIGVCHGFTAIRKFFVANVHNLNGFNPNQDPVFMEWAKRSPINMAECHSCPGLGICGGGCAMNAHARHGSIWTIDDIFCPQTKKILKWMIEDTYEQMTNLAD
jgi:uncharacterized protein